MKHGILWIVALWMLCSCQPDSSMVENKATGYAQGTYYQIKYITPEKEDWQTSFDSIFQYIDRSMSTYLESSTISAINTGDTMLEVDPLFMEVLNRSIEIAEETRGSFDPTIGPLVAYWGFGKKASQNVDEAGAEHVLQFTGYKNIRIEGNKVGVPPGFQLDFNAIAQGYTTDVISRFIEQRGVERYMAEVGGEVRARGKNINNEIWRIGIDKPSEKIDEASRFQVIIALKDKALATSGNYRKFWVDEETGLKYAHTIDPHSGKPARNQLLSVSIISDSCMDADAYATACMVMGKEKALQFVKTKPGLEAYFVSSTEKGDWEVLQTPGFAEYVVN